jgi:hypothetical protein
MVVRELMGALLHADTPDVGETSLPRVSGLKVGRLRDVFRGSAAWGELVIQGRTAGTYRLYSPPAVAPEGEVGNPNDAGGAG